jgi:hypothetical protein
MEEKWRLKRNDGIILDEEAIGEWRKKSEITAIHIHGSMTNNVLVMLKFYLSYDISLVSSIL